MVSTIETVFETYQKSDEYNQSTVEIDFSWLCDKLSQDEIADVENYAAMLVLFNEKDIFFHGFQMAWTLFHALSENK